MVRPYRKTRGRGGDKGRRSEDGSEGKLYLQPAVLELRVPEPDLVFLTDLPGGLDSKEWIAMHSKRMMSGNMSRTLPA